MKRKLNTASLCMLIILLSFSACQGMKTTASDQNSSGSQNGGESEEPQVYTEPDDIKIMLDELERLRWEQWLAQPGWWHEQKVIQSQSGNLHGTSAEWWFQHSDAATCPMILQIIYQEDGQVLETSVLISESKIPTVSQNVGASGAENGVLLVKIPDQSCPQLLESSLEHIKQMLNDSTTLKSAQAVIQDGALTITLSQEEEPYRQEITVTIDTASGFITYEKVQLYVNNRENPEGEIEYNYLHQHYDELPSEIQNQLDQGLAKLQ
jgi:hypothetical protein